MVDTTKFHQRRGGESCARHWSQVTAPPQMKVSLNQAAKGGSSLSAKLLFLLDLFSSCLLGPPEPWGRATVPHTPVDKPESPLLSWTCRHRASDCYITCRPSGQTIFCCCISAPVCHRITDTLRRKTNQSMSLVRTHICPDQCTIGLVKFDGR